MKVVFIRSFVLACALLLTACDRFFSDLTVVNDSTVEVHNVSFSDGRKIWQLGDLKPKQSTHLSVHMHGEGSGSISWTYDGRRLKREGCYYTGWQPARGLLRIHHTSLSYRCR